MTQGMGREVSPERIYLEAVRAAGPADDVTTWRAKVDTIAGEIHTGLKAFVRRLTAVAESITLHGTVQEAIESVQSEDGSKTLDLYKVVFRADSGNRPDHLWIDKRDPARASLFAEAKALIGKRAVIVKERRVRFNGDEPEMRDGVPVTSPYLGSIKPEVGESAAPSTAPAAAEAAKGEEAATSPKIRKLLAIAPSSTKQLVELADEHFGMKSTEVRDAVIAAIGTIEQGQRRSPTDLKKAWSAIVYAHSNAA